MEDSSLTETPCEFAITSVALRIYIDSVVVKKSVDHERLQGESVCEGASKRNSKH